MISEGKWKGLQESYYQLLVRSWVVGKEDMWIALQRRDNYWRDRLKSAMSSMPSG